jgi:hypothetical protein
MMTSLSIIGARYSREKDDSIVQPLTGTTLSIIGAHIAERKSYNQAFVFHFCLNSKSSTFMLEVSIQITNKQAIQRKNNKSFEVKRFTLFIFKNLWGSSRTSVINKIYFV